MLLETSRICAWPVAFYNNFDKHNGDKRLFVREGPEDGIVFSNILQPPTGSVRNSSYFSNVWLRNFCRRISMETCAEIGDP